DSPSARQYDFCWKKKSSISICGRDARAPVQLTNGSATLMRGKSLTCRLDPSLNYCGLRPRSRGSETGKFKWRSDPASRRLAAHRSGIAILQVTQQTPLNYYAASISCNAATQRSHTEG